ncbi:hypothetical protein GCM10018782_30800 [Streptomyces griseoaurantiacus]|nr:hypothetical protein GCM10018782_30800 [Streptomyces griseoaurantiacus]
MTGREISAVALPLALQRSLRRLRRFAYTSDMPRAYELWAICAGWGPPSGARTPGGVRHPRPDAPDGPVTR